MNQKFAELIAASRRYGSDKSFVIAGGGNTSYKDDKMSKQGKTADENKRITVEYHIEVLLLFARDAVVGRFSQLHCLLRWLGLCRAFLVKHAD